MCNCSQAWENIEIKKWELESIRSKKFQGIILRSKLQWITEGEKPTKYFCNLESKNFTNKIIPKIQKENGKVISNQTEILGEIESFYKMLYTKEISPNMNIDLETELKYIPINKLSNEESSMLEVLIIYEEASNTLKNMKNDKSPGSSGFTTEFFKVYWGEVGHFVVRSLNYDFEQGQFSVTQRQGVITCLPTRDKPRQFLQNWRPTTLLSTSYTIAAGSIANRVKKLLQNLIAPDQTGFILGRFIGENTCLLYDLMQSAEENNLPGILLFIPEIMKGVRFTILGFPT